MVRFQHIQLTDLHIQITFFDDQRIAGSQRLDFGVAQGGFVHIIRNSGRGFAGHDLSDKFLLILHKLVEVRIKCTFRDITENFNLRILITLTDDSAQPLGKVRRTPRTINIMQSNQFILTIRACAHLGGAANQHPHLTGTDFGEQFFLSHLRIGFMDVGDFLRWNTFFG